MNTRQNLINYILETPQNTNRRLLDQKIDELSESVLGTVIEISTAEAMDALLIAENVDKAYKFIGETDENYTNGDIYIVKENVE